MRILKFGAQPSRILIFEGRTSSKVIPQLSRPGDSSYYANCSSVGFGHMCLIPREQGAPSYQYRRLKKHTSGEEETCGKLCLKNTKAGAGEQFLLWDCRAGACAKGVFNFTDTGISQAASPYRLGACWSLSHSRQLRTSLSSLGTCYIYIYIYIYIHISSSSSSSSSL